MILYPTLRRELGYIDNNYATAHDAEIAEWGFNPTGFICVGQVHVTGYGYRICRGVFKFDLSSLSPTEDIFYAALQSSNYIASNPYEGCALDGTGLTGVVTDWGPIRLLTTVLGLASFPKGGSLGGTGYNPYLIIFNAAGREFIKSKAGGTLTLALRTSQDIANIPPRHPPVDSYEEFYLHLYPNTTLLINVTGGYIWVEGTNFAFLDQWRQKQLYQGIKDGAVGVTPGYIWIEGTKLRYIDSYGDERYIEGELGGVTGIPGQIFIGSIWVGYIDANGDGRSFTTIF